jgi:hypothetical protein
MLIASTNGEFSYIVDSKRAARVEAAGVDTAVVGKKNRAVSHNRLGDRANVIETRHSVRPETNRRRSVPSKPETNKTGDKGREEAGGRDLGRARWRKLSDGEYPRRMVESKGKGRDGKGSVTHVEERRPHQNSRQRRINGDGFGGCKKRRADQRRRLKYCSSRDVGGTKGPYLGQE